MSQLHLQAVVSAAEAFGRADHGGGDYVRLQIAIAEYLRVAALTQPPSPVAAEGYVLVPVEQFRGEVLWALRQGARIGATPDELAKTILDCPAIASRPPIGETVPGAGEALRAKVVALWKLLDDIDTLDDAAKADDAGFRKRAYSIQRKRFDILSGEAFDALAAPPIVSTQEGEAP